MLPAGLGIKKPFGAVSKGVGPRCGYTGDPTLTYLSVALVGMSVNVFTRLSNLAIGCGPLAAIIVYIALPQAYVDVRGDHVPLDDTARAALAIAAWMVLCWLTEALPVSVTALLPIVVFPLLGLASVREVTAPYAHPLIFLFLGGFLLSIAIQKWSLHSWIAHHVVRVAGGNTHRLIGGFMGIAAFSSMWLSNTATTIMMLPITMSMINAADAKVAKADADRFIGAQLIGFGGVPTWLLFGAVITGVVFLTEMTSNTATTTTLIPVLAAAAVALGLDPFALIIVTALAASCAFMMPVATPPNAIVFSSGRVSIPEMARAGLVINIVAIIVITLGALLWVPHTVTVGARP